MATRQELNQAILTVITTQFKKDAKEAHKMVEDAGYEICKIGGGFRVWNNATRASGRFVELCISKNGYRSYIQYGPYLKMRVEYKYTKEVAFDFVGCLDKPVNTVYYQQMQKEYNYESKAIRAYEKVKSARWHIQYETDRIARIQKDLAKLQAELVHATESKVRNEQDLVEVKKQVGLIK